MNGDSPALPPPFEIWGGVECTVNRVHDHWFDQVWRSGHDNRLDDLDRFAALGITAIRYPVLWERTAPSTLDTIDWRWSDERLNRLRELRIRPIVGLLHHGSGPRYTSLVDDDFPEKLARFAGAVADRYPWVTDFTPINEPLTTARFSALYGHWYPHHRDPRTFMRALLNQLRGIVLAMRAIRCFTPGARLLQTEDCGRTFGTPATARQVEHEEHRRWLTWDLLTGCVDAAHPLRPWLLHAGVTDEDLRFFTDHPCPPDVLGLNYYVTSDRFLDTMMGRYPAWSHGGNGRVQYADVEAVRARWEGVVGHEDHLVSAWERYRVPVALTEVHLACTREEQMRWLAESWHAARRARDRGARVAAVTAWALLGSYDWDSLVTHTAGGYEPGVFDLRSPRLRPTALARMLHAMASGDEPTHPTLAVPGWWRRPERLAHVRTGPAPSPTPAGPPLVIIGSTGTLGRAFQRTAEVRGLTCRLVGRHEVDITDPTGVDAMLRRIEPWAVINAAGYVRVDDAEDEPQVCHRVNVIGPANLAAACRRRGLPLVTFSSDLVFDGHARRPYTEKDARSPLNVYGASKAEAERRVFDLLPTALVIRTSAFFGPWDESNFLATLFRALDAEATFTAAADTTVSPTYIPDLVDATLDLLIDSECGIWHLANEGALTWWEFARRAATMAGRSVDRICPAAAKDIWSPALRPAYSALTSTRGALMRPLDDAVAAYLAVRETHSTRGAQACVSP